MLRGTTPPAGTPVPLPRDEAGSGARGLEGDFAFAHNGHVSPIDKLEGRITTSLLTPYPPGIPLLIPGEVFNKKIVDYLKFTREFNAAFPGFDTDVHGLVMDEATGHYYVDCVAA